MKTKQAHKEVKSFRMQTFDDAAQIFLAAVKLQVAPITWSDYTNYVKRLSPFFGKMRMDEIEIEDIEEYQRLRSNQIHHGKPVGAVSINHEIGLVLRQMLKRTGRWAVIGPRYKKILNRKDGPGRALSEDEETRLRRICRDVVEKQPTWEVAALATLLSLGTTMGPGEIKCLQLKDVELTSEPPRIKVPVRGAKRKRRARPVVLSGDTLWAAQRLVERAEELGCRAPDHFLLPFRNKRGTYDPARPSKGWRYALREILVRADIKARCYDFRHHAITKVLENPECSEETAVALAGWISPSMKANYSHVRLERLAEAAAILGGKKSGATVEIKSNGKKRRSA